MIEHLFGLIAVVFLIWSAVLVWASWQLGCALSTLINERRELRRWRRLKDVYDKQRARWQ